MASTTALLLLLGVLCVGFASVRPPAPEIVVDCCLRVANIPLPLKYIKNYTIQLAGKGCEISAIVFTTKLRRKVCLPYPNDKQWVRTYIKYLDQKRSRPQ